ncbi:MAG TPA: ATP-binding cassette domain-containing protein [Gemmataceae bacterium]|nr:ATP-binding cassette domain-containing protein [Gemmataceae bacterium]
MIQVDDLTKTFGPVVAVDHISFQVAQGEIVGFLGPNGAGKTTTLRILTSYLPATSGIARVAGFDVMTQSLEVRRHIGYLPESVPLYPEMRVEEYLTYRAKLKEVDRKERQKHVDYCLERCRIREVRRRLIGTLSRGYRQRVGLADAMIHDPAILILDEPTAGLDPIQIRDTLALIRELGRQHTILLSTHILPEVEAVCERVIIINTGRIGLSKKLSDLATAAATIVVEVRGPAEQVTNALRTLDGVERVTAQALDDGLTSFEIHTQHNQDLREVISQRMAKNGWPIRRLDLRRPKLEDLFVDVVVRRDGPLQAPDSGGHANGADPLERQAVLAGQDR